MGVKNLWQALERGGAVETLDGAVPAQHDAILAELEDAVVAVDASAWLVQALTQPALTQNYPSDYACVMKVVFERTIHWLRHGCLPVFVIEGRTPTAKLELLRQRAVAAYGPAAASWRVGNNSHFRSLGEKVAEMLDLMGVPWVRASGEGEATCAALNMCGWAQGCSTADVDALLFGALTVYRTLTLSTSIPKNTQMARCCREAVQRVLGLERGGTQALIAVAQLAGGDYDGGAERVGELSALAAVRQLLGGRRDDSGVLEALQAALAAGPDASLDALTHCTGCKCCGHEGGLKSVRKRHGKEGCAACGTAGPDGGGGCVPASRECQCRFHTTAGARLLNRVVRNALRTGDFLEGCRAAADTYASEARRAVEAVRRDHGLAQRGAPNTFRWSRRPDVRGLAAMLTQFIPDWDYNQVRLKLLPLLLEWDVRCGPSPLPESGVQLRPLAIKKVAGVRTAQPQQQQDAGGEVPPLPEDGWRYVIEVERLRPTKGSGAGAGGSGTRGGREQGGGGGEPSQSRAEAEEAEDLAIDTAWLNNTARSRPPRASPLRAHALFGASGSGGAGGGSPSHAAATAVAASQASQQLDGEDGSGGEGKAEAGGSQTPQRGGATPKKAQGSLSFAEHRSVRCTLMHELFPNLVRTFAMGAKKAPRKKAAASGSGAAPGRARKGGAAAKKAAASVAGATAGHGERQLTVKDFFAVKKPVGKAEPAGVSGSGRGVGAGRAAAVPRAWGLGGLGAADPAGPAGGAGDLRLPVQQQQQQQQCRQEPEQHGAFASGASQPGARPSSARGALDRFLLQAAAGDILTTVRSSSGGSGSGSDGEEPQSPAGRRGDAAPTPFGLCDSPDAPLPLFERLRQALGAEEGDLQQQRAPRFKTARSAATEAAVGPAAAAAAAALVPAGTARAPTAAVPRMPPRPAPSQLPHKAGDGSGSSDDAVAAASPAKKACTPDAKQRAARAPAASPLGTPPADRPVDWVQRQYRALAAGSGGDDSSDSDGAGAPPPREHTGPLRRRQLFRTARSGEVDGTAAPGAVGPGPAKGAPPAGSVVIDLSCDSP